MKRLQFLLILGLWSNIVFSQAYLKPYLEHKRSGLENELIPVVLKLNKQVDLQQLKETIRAKGNIELQEQRKLLVKTLYKSNTKLSGFDVFIQELQENYPSEIQNIKPFWIVNAMACKVSSRLLDTLLQSSYIDYIQYDMPVMAERVEESAITDNRAVGGAEPGLVAINARGLWALGYTGRNRLAMNIDTGVSPEHSAFSDRFLGVYLPLSQAWFGYEHDFPYDIDRSHFHGTHTMGTMVGLDRGTADTIGLAFNAFWIASDPIVTRTEDIRPMSDYFIAFQWALNPDSNLETTNDIPDVINNSWGVNYDMWPDCDPIEYDFIEALEAADCSVIFSAGNEGPDEQTTGMPASISKDSLNIFSVGALDGADPDYTIANFSSRGPSECDLETKVGIKPEVSAPGVNVRSASGNNGYRSLSGTSMAGPHVAGAILLLREAFPNVSSKYLKNALYQTAIDLGDEGEDNTYGRGLIDVYEAYLFLSQTYTPTPPVTQQFDIAIDTIKGQQSFVCNANSHYEVVVKNTGEETVSDFVFRFILNSDTLIESTINVSLESNQIYSIPVDVNFSDTLTNLLFSIEKEGLNEYNIYNNYRSFRITRLFENEIPFYEDFEHLNADLSGSNYLVVNPDIQNTWLVDSAKGIEDSYLSLKMPFVYYNSRGELDYLLFGAFNIPSGNTRLTFKHAYTQYFNSKKDSLFILVSTDCSLNSGNVVYRNGGAEMKTIESNYSGRFVPKTADEWADNTVDLSAYAGQTIFLKFIAKNDGSNNLYIDELNIQNSINIKKVVESTIKYYPNPTTGELFFENIEDGVLLSVIDITGKKVLQTQIKNRKINVSTLNNGIYFMRTDSGINAKFIIQK